MHAEPCHPQQSRGPFRVAILRIMHESNSFSPLKSDLDHFRACDEIRLGRALLEKSERRDEITGFLNVLGSPESNVDVVPLLGMSGLAGGYVTDTVTDFLEHTLREQLRGAGVLHGVLAALHGAMASESIRDLDGHLLQIIRDEVGPEIPIVCSLDLHGVVSLRVVESCTAIAGYHTHPHIDVVATGERAATLLLRTLRREIRPAMAWRKIPMLFPPPDDGTNSGAMKEVYEATKAYVDGKVIVDCSLFCPYCWLDAPAQGAAAIAITDGDSSLAQRIADEIAARLWSARRQFEPEKMFAAPDAVAMAARIVAGPVVVTDSADTTGSGSPGDNTVLLQALLEARRSVNGTILHHIPDADAVSQLHKSRLGSIAELAVGGKRDTRFCRPLEVRGEVVCVTEGIIEDVGRFTMKPYIDAGKTVCLRIDNIFLVLTERMVIGPQPSLFRKVGIEPFHAHLVALKTGVGFKPTYGHIAKAVIHADCPGAASYNLRNYTYTLIQRPMYPFDADMKWTPSSIFKA